MKRFIILLIVFIAILNLSILSSAEDISDVYENTDLSISYTFNSSSNAVQLQDPLLYQSILNDISLNGNNVDKYEFILYLECSEGGGTIRTPSIRIDDSVILGNDVSVALAYPSNANNIVPFIFTVDNINITEESNISVQFRVAVSRVPFTFSVVGISCRAIRSDVSDNNLVFQRIANNTYAISFVLTIVVAILICMMGIKLFKSLFYAFS